MEQYRDLLGRRTADTQPYDVARRPAVDRLQRGEPVFGFAPARLLSDPNGQKRTRPGDQPTDLEPERVPLERRAPRSRLSVPKADTEVAAHARALSTIIESHGHGDDPFVREKLDELDAQLEPGANFQPEQIAGRMMELIDLVDRSEEGFDDAALTAMEENLSSLADLGFREPFDYVRDVILDLGDEDDTSDEEIYGYHE